MHWSIHSLCHNMAWKSSYIPVWQPAGSTQRFIIDESALVNGELKVSLKSLARSSHMGTIINGKQVFEWGRSYRCSEHIKTQIQLQTIPAVIEKQEDGLACEHLCQQPLTWHTGWPAQPVWQPPVCDDIWIWSPCLWRSFSQKRLYFILKKQNKIIKKYKQKIIISGLDCIASLFFVEKHLFDEVVVLSIGKYLQGYLRRDEFRVGSYWKEQRHLSLGSSVTMAWGGGPRSQQQSSVSRAHLEIKYPLLLHLLRLTCCHFANHSFYSPWSVAISRRGPSRSSLSHKINMVAHSEHSRDGFIQCFQSGQQMDSTACPITLFLLDSLTFWAACFVLRKYTPYIETCWPALRSKPALRRSANKTEHLFFWI